ncbi:MAG: diphosphomevalonate decarboxylase, partial [Flavobacterium sp.]
MYSDLDFIISNYCSIEAASFSWSAPSNIALVKYWGKKEVGDQIPANPSISFTLKNCKTITSVTISSKV